MKDRAKPRKRDRLSAQAVDAAFVAWVRKRFPMPTVDRQAAARERREIEAADQ